MNIPELKAAIARKGFTIPTLAEVIGISKKTLYRKVDCESSFTQKEISAIVSALNLTNDEIISIFFTDKVA